MSNLKNVEISGPGQLLMTRVGRKIQVTLKSRDGSYRRYEMDPAEAALVADYLNECLREFAKGD